MSDEESEEDETGVDGNSDEGEDDGEQDTDGGKEAPPLQFGPPKGRSRLSQVKSTISRDHPVEGNILLLFGYLY